MLAVGDQLPEFNLKAVVPGSRDFKDIGHETYKGKWMVLFFYPKDFTFVCPTEIKGFSEMNKDFQERKCANFNRFSGFQNMSIWPGKTMMRI